VKAEAERDRKRLNFLALVFCMMVGTAALPHILMRYYTTPSVQEARNSVFWSLFCIFLLYFTAPALAVLVKFELYTTSSARVLGAAGMGVSLGEGRSDPDVDHRRQQGRHRATGGDDDLGGDIIVLATPEIAGLPYVISGLVAAGGLAAALSTADGLLLTIANALSHDLYYKMINPNATTQKRVMISKVLLLVVAVGRAWVTAQKPGTSCSWWARRSPWRRRCSSLRSCWACSGSAPTSGVRYRRHDRRVLAPRASTT
jgi:cation/acetate symporter